MGWSAAHCSRLHQSQGDEATFPVLLTDPHTPLILYCSSTGRHVHCVRTGEGHPGPAVAARQPWQQGPTQGCGWNQQHGPRAHRPDCCNSLSCPDQHAADCWRVPSLGTSVPHFPITPDFLHTCRASCSTPGVCFRLFEGLSVVSSPERAC